MPTLNLIFIGPPGAGKGTQSRLLAQSRDLCRVSTGELLRAQQGIGRTSRAVFETMQYGGLVGDDLIMAIVHERLASVDPTRGCVFDGIPRTLDQALMLDDLLRTRRERPLVVIELRLPDIYIPRRLKARRICSQCGTPGKVDPLVRICLECDGRLVSRDDDRPEIALARLRRYRVESEPMFKYYRRLGVLRTINAARVEQIVTARIEKHLDERLMDFYANRLPVSSRNDRRASG